MKTKFDLRWRKRHADAKRLHDSRRNKKRGRGLMKKRSVRKWSKNYRNRNVELRNSSREIKRKSRNRDFWSNKGKERLYLRRKNEERNKKNLLIKLRRY
jgi:hypothetical protein